MDYALGSDGEAQPKRLTGTSPSAPLAERNATDAINRALSYAERKINSKGTEEQKAAWNRSVWRWDPANPVFQADRDTAAFVDPADPDTVTVGMKMASFKNSEMNFTYHGTSFNGGTQGLRFAILHEFGHISTQGQGQPGPVRERLANSVALSFMGSLDKKEGAIKCLDCP